MADELSPKAQILMEDIKRRQTAGANRITKALAARVGEGEIQYNKDQLEAYDKIQQFLKSTEVHCSLVGAAGTGKTTLLKKVIQGLSRVSISAPTHKAKLEAGIRTDVKNLFTLAELLGLNPDVDIADFDPHNPVFAQKREPKMGEFFVNIIDEASMVNKHLHQKVIETAVDCGVQVIFTGDACQLPPVKESIAVALDGDNVITLHTIIRQEKSNPLTYLLAVLRYMQEIYTNTIFDTKERFDEIFELILSFQPEISYDTLYRKRYDMFLYLVKTFPEHLVDGKGFKVVNDNETFFTKATKGIESGGRILAFTNATVAECNNEVRKRKGFTKQFEIDEIITSYKTLRDDKNNMFFTNSLDYKIVGKQPKINIHDFQVIRLELVDNYYMNRTFIDVLHPDEYNKFMDKYTTVLNEAKSGKGWPRFFCFKDAHCITRCNNLGTTLKSDFEYGYALTIHKSQGSTYKYVYVRADDIFRYMKTDRNYYSDIEVNESILFSLKLLYVALSRATDVAIIKF